jgi:hypothetical protein
MCAPWLTLDIQARRRTSLVRSRKEIKRVGKGGGMMVALANRCCYGLQHMDERFGAWRPAARGRWP